MYYDFVHTWALLHTAGDTPPHTPLFLILLFPFNPTSGILAKMTSFSWFYQSKNCLNTWRFPPCSKKALKKKKKKSPPWGPLSNKKIPLWCIKCVQTSWIHYCHVSKNDLFLKILWLLWLWLFAPPVQEKKNILLINCDLLLAVAQLHTSGAPFSFFAPAPQRSWVRHCQSSKNDLFLMMLLKQKEAKHSRLGWKKAVRWVSVLFYQRHASAVRGSIGRGFKRYPQL